MKRQTDRQTEVEKQKTDIIKDPRNFPKSSFI